MAVKELKGMAAGEEAALVAVFLRRKNTDVYFFGEGGASEWGGVVLKPNPRRKRGLRIFIL